MVENSPLEIKTEPTEDLEYKNLVKTEIQIKKESDESSEGKVITYHGDVFNYTGISLEEQETPINDANLADTSTKQFRNFTCIGTEINTEAETKPVTNLEELLVKSKYLGQPFCTEDDFGAKLIENSLMISLRHEIFSEASDYSEIKASETLEMDSANIFIKQNQGPEIIELSPAELLDNSLTRTLSNVHSDTESVESVENPLANSLVNALLKTCEVRLNPNPSRCKKIYKCPWCDYETKWKKCQEIHMLNHTGIKMLRCPKCSYESNRRDHMKIHMLNHSNIKVYSCTKCSYKTNRKDHYKIHLLNHTDTKIYKCSDCPYETNTRTCMRNHVLNHTNIKVFKCEDCSYETHRKNNLNLHVLRHTDRRRFKCSECAYETYRRSDLRRHAISHSEVKLFNCPECKFETNFKYKLRNHFSGKHTEKTLDEV